MMAAVVQRGGCVGWVGGRGRAKPRLLVFGEGPAGDTMSRLAELTGFRPRAVSQAEIGSLEIPPGDGYAVVATMGHYDEEALEAALSHPDLDVSLIASTRRAAAARQALLRRGLHRPPISRAHPTPPTESRP